jgi:formylmethanofuran dehydrogenase subunit B
MRQRRWQRLLSRRKGLVVVLKMTSCSSLCDDHTFHLLTTVLSLCQVRYAVFVETEAETRISQVFARVRRSEISRDADTVEY